MFAQEVAANRGDRFAEYFILGRLIRFDSERFATMGLSMGSTIGTTAMTLDRTTQSTILTGAGGHFCSGLDLAEHEQRAPVAGSRTKGPRYTPVSKRQDKPDGIAWILRNHPEISDAQIGKLIGTTRNTIGAIRDRSHWNLQNIQPKDPVTLGLC